MNVPLLIVGLGNPGDEYLRTRHNVGFRVIDAYVAEDDSPLRSKRDVSLAELIRGTSRVYAMKPHSFMNASGEPVSSFMRYYKITAERLIVVHDDLDLEFGKIKTAFDRGDAGHQGVASIIGSLGSKKFHRLRIGIGSNRPLGIPSEDYVLQQFSKTEEVVVEKTVIPGAVEKLQDMERALLQGG